MVERYEFLFIYGREVWKEVLLPEWILVRLYHELGPE